MRHHDDLLSGIEKGHDDMVASEGGVESGCCRVRRSRVAAGVTLRDERVPGF